MVRVYRLSEAGRRERSERMTRLHADPEFAARHAAAASKHITRLNADPEFAARNAAAASETMKRLHTDPEFVTKQAAAASECMKRRLADPELAAEAGKRLRAGKALRRAYGDYWKRGEPHPGF